MVRIISQATYDDVVKENLEEFDMSPEEAIKEAIAQFEAQGVNLSNIIKDLALHERKDEHIVSSAVKALGELKDNWKENNDALIETLDILKSECSKDLARRVRAGKEGAYNALLDILEHSTDSVPTVRIVETLTALMDTQPDLLNDRGVNLMKRLLKNDDVEVRIRTLQWISTCCLKHEMNRQAVFKSNMSTQLVTMLKEKPENKELTELLVVMRRLTLDDDIRVAFGKAHEHAREIAIHTLPTLTQILKERSGDARVACDLMLTTAMLLVRNELCQAVADSGGCEILFHVCTTHYDAVGVAMQAFKLIKALAGNDDVKRSLMKSGIAPVIVSLLNRHISNPKACSLALSCVSALTLREADHGRQFVDNSAGESIVEAMKLHGDSVYVQRSACWAIRNTVSRSRELSTRFLELGAEAYLNEAKRRLGGEIEQEVKAALRDLDCEVKLEEQWRGTGQHVSND